MKEINICIDKIEDITEKFNNEVLSNDISSYIISESLTVKKNEKVIININSREKLNDEDRKYIEKLIKNNYMKMYSEKILIKEYQNKQNFILVVLGILFVFISNLLKNENILSELFLIVGWVSLWEVIHKVLFDNIKDKIKLQRYKKLSESEINYTNKKKP